MLSSNPQTPVVSQSSMSFDLLQSLKIFSQFVVQSIRSQLRELSILEVLLPIEEPVGELELSWVVNDGEQLLNLFFIQFSCSFVGINVCLLATQVGKPTSNSFDGSQCVHNLSSSIDVGIEDSKNMLKLLRIHQSRLFFCRSLSYTWQVSREHWLVLVADSFYLGQDIVCRYTTQPKDHTHHYINVFQIR